MAKPINADYNTDFLFPPSLNDWVSPKDPVRFICGYVDALNLSQLGFKDQYQPQSGRPGYAYSLLLKILILGYMERINSFRQLEAACWRDIRFMWLAGMNKPDHNAFWRFWSEHHHLIAKVYKDSIKTAGKMGLVGYVTFAVDGTKIQAASSGHSGCSREDLEKKLKQVETEISQLEEQLAQNKDQVSGCMSELPEQLANQNVLKEKILETVKQMDEINRNQLHPGEPDARMMPCEGRWRFAYNAQAVADAQAGIIVAAEVTNTENDQRQLLPMLKEAVENTGRVPQNTLVDAGYVVAQEIAQAEKTGTNVLSPPALKSKEKKFFHASHFQYEESKDVVKCPLGQELVFENATTRTDRGPFKVYRCKSHRDCPMRGQCSKDPKGRKIEIGNWVPILNRQREKLLDPENKKLLQERGVIVEPVFARIKVLLGIRRWFYKQIEKVRSQWCMMCFVSNLIIIFNRKVREWA